MRPVAAVVAPAGRVILALPRAVAIYRQALTTSPCRRRAAPSRREPSTVPPARGTCACRNFDPLGSGPRIAPKRPVLSNFDRLIFVCLYRIAPRILDAVAILEPETVIRWHREGDLPRKAGKRSC